MSAQLQDNSRTLTYKFYSGQRKQNAIFHQKFCAASKILLSSQINYVVKIGQITDLASSMLQNIMQPSYRSASGTEFWTWRYRSNPSCYIKDWNPSDCCAWVSLPLDLKFTFATWCLLSDQRFMISLCMKVNPSRRHTTVCLVPFPSDISLTNGPLVRPIVWTKHCPCYP